MFSLALPDLERLYKVIVELLQEERNRVSLAGGTNISAISPRNPASGSPHFFLTNTFLW